MRILHSIVCVYHVAVSSEAANSNKAGIRYHGIKRGLIERGDSCYNRHESMVNEMSEQYYKPCRELQICNELIEKYFQTRQYQKCFEGHLALARQGYPLAECQVGYFYYDGLGTEKDLEKAVYWTRRAAHHGDRDGQYNLAWFYEDATGVERDMEQAVFWYRKAALQGHDLAMEKCRELGIEPHASAVDPKPLRRDLRCRVYPLGSLVQYKYTVVCTWYQGKWLLSRHRDRSTWETQGGHIEEGETPLECAKRELFEESGIRDARIYPVCDYWGFNSLDCSNGMVFLAVVRSPVLYAEAAKFLAKLLPDDKLH